MKPTSSSSVPFIEELNKSLSSPAESKGTICINDFLHKIHSCPGTEADSIKNLPLHKQLNKIIKLYATSTERKKLTNLKETLQNLPETKLLSKKTRITLLKALQTPTESRLKTFINYLSTQIIETWRTFSLFRQGFSLAERKNLFIECSNLENMIRKAETTNEFITITENDLITKLHSLKKTPEEFRGIVTRYDNAVHLAQCLNKSIPTLEKSLEKTTTPPLNSSENPAPTKKPTPQIDLNAKKQLIQEQNFLKTEVESFLRPYLTGETKNTNRPDLCSQLFPKLKKQFPNTTLSEEQAQCLILSFYLTHSAQRCLPPIRFIAGNTRENIQNDLKKNFLPNFEKALKQSLKIDFIKMNLTDSEKKFLAQWGMEHTTMFDEKKPFLDVFFMNRNRQHWVKLQAESKKNLNSYLDTVGQETREIYTRGTYLST